VAGPPAIPPDIQLVRFRVPAGAHVEILGPAPEPIALAEGRPQDIHGLKVGVGYRLRIWDIPDRPGAEVFPVVEVVGHLHRPPGIDPAKFPIRIVFGPEDLADAVDRGRLVTQVVYLEHPEQALPIALPKDEIPVVTLNPTEEPLKVGSALGRVMAIVRLGGRRPTMDELGGPGLLGPGMAGSARCPFVGTDGNPCRMPCGPVCGTPPPPDRPWVPRDEYLCDGGDQAEPVHIAGDGGLAGIDPRDAALRFDDTTRPRVLPTNVVCVYAPRFAVVRTAVGPNEALNVEGPWRASILERQAGFDARQGSRRLTQNQAAELDRARLRASGLKGRVYAGSHTELRVLNGFDASIHDAHHIITEGVELTRIRQKAGLLKEKLPPLAIKTLEKTVVTGVAEGAGRMVMSWAPRETVGVEVPPNKPGMAVVKRVSAGEAEPGDVLTYVIQFRNMGNTPIRAVTIVDSLLPRLGYVAGSALGPEGTIFTAVENKVGSTELRWDLPAPLAPGAEGYVLFKATVR
jgi:uncharacterized repeat protein (TIGR01451 family)